MKGLPILIRLSTNVVDEKRRILTQLRKAEEQLRQDRRDLEDEVLREQQVAASSYSAGLTYADYGRQVMQRRERLERAITAMQADVAHAEEELAEAFQEQKRYELALEEQQRKRVENFKRLEAQRLDEVASTRFGRGEK
jgi:flagellar protein FliJ